MSEPTPPADPKANLLSNPTRAYRPAGGTNYLGAALAVADGKPFFTWLDVHRMLRDPRVRFLERMWRSPFQRVKFKVHADSPRVQKYVGHTLRRFWTRGLPKILARYFRWGYGAGGAEFAHARGLVRLDRVRCVEPRDARPLVWAGGRRQGEPAGFSAPGVGRVLVPHAVWFAGHAEVSPWYDLPPIAGAFEPWLEKRGRNGAIDSRRLWFLKHAIKGAVLYHPSGLSNVGTDENPQYRDNQDLAREMLDYLANGSGITLANDRHPADPSKYNWDLVPAESRPDVAGLREYPGDLDKEMAEGVGIPNEVIEAADVGSGWSGRMVPLMGWLGGVDELVGLAVEAFDPTLKYAVGANFGREAWYEVEPQSLVDQAQEQAQAGKGGGEGENPIPSLLGQQPKPPAGGREMSGSGFVSRATRRKVKRLLAARDLSDGRGGGKRAPKGGVAIGGRKYPGGQFVPGDVIARMTPAERAAWKKQAAAGKAPDPARRRTPPDRSHVTAGLAEAVAAADPKAAAKPRLMARLADKAVTAAARVHLALVKLTPAMLKAIEVVEAVADTPADMLHKFGYNPSSSSGTAGPQTLDPVKANLGISSHLAAQIAGHVLAKGLVWVKRKTGYKLFSEDPDPTLGAAQVLREALAALAAEFGLPEPPPAETIAAHLAAAARPRELSTGPSPPTHAGLCVRAGDTGRVLVLRRADTPGDPAAGLWEFPGGRIEPGESPFGAARREWAEEVGRPVPGGRLGGDWRSADGVYAGHVLTVPAEAAVGLDGRAGDAGEAVAWRHPDDLAAADVRPELVDSLPDVRAAIGPVELSDGRGGGGDDGKAAAAAGSDDNPDHLRLLGYVAALIQERFARRGKSAAAARYLDQLADLASDPDELGRLLGGRELSWVPYEGPKGGHGWRHSETGRVVYGGHRPGDRKAERAKTRAERAERAKEATAAAKRLASGDADPADVETLAAAIPNMTVAQLRETRQALGAKLGTRWRDNMARVLLGHVRAKVEKARAGPAEKPAAGGTKESAAGPRALPTPDAADAWGREHYGEWAKSLPADERKAVGRYRFSDYRPLNAALRAAGGDLDGPGAEAAVATVDRPLVSSAGTKPTVGEVKAAVEKIDAALARATVPEDVTAYRGVTGDFAAGLKPGAEFTDPGYGSTSLAADAADNYGAGETVLRVTVPKGTHAAYITALEASKGHEQEMLLPRNTRYRITGETTEGGRRVLTAEVVPAGPAAAPAAPGPAAAGAAPEPQKPAAPKPAETNPQAGPAPAPAAPAKARGKTPAKSGTPAWAAADPRHAALLDAHATAPGQAKRVMETALTNSGHLEDAPGGGLRVARQAPGGDEFAGRDPGHMAAAGLATGHRWLAEHGGTPEELEHVGRAIEAAGGQRLGEPGETVPFDPTDHEEPSPGYPTGEPVRVVHPGWVTPTSRHVETTVKARVEPAGPA